MPTRLICRRGIIMLIIPGTICRARRMVRQAIMEYRMSTIRALITAGGRVMITTP